MDGWGRRRGSLGRAGWLATLVLGLGLLPFGEVLAATSLQDALIPVLGTTMDQHPVGQVVYLGLSFENRQDESGLAVVFKSAPGRFSRMTQTAVEEAIYRAARAMDVSPHSWTVFLSLPYPGVTLYGESCAAMVAISVVMMAKGAAIPSDRVITGTVTPDGRIGPVGAVSLKVAAANEAHLRRVLVPDEQDKADKDWETPFLMQVSPVGTVQQAYEALTDAQALHAQAR